MGSSVSAKAGELTDADVRPDTECLPTSFSSERALRHCGRPVISAGRYHDSRPGRGGRSLHDDFKADPEMRVLGHGTNVEVVSLIGRADGRRYALKTFCKEGKSPVELGLLINELEIQIGLDHPHIVRIEGVYETNEDFHLVMECCEGGELYDRLRQRGVYSERQAASTARQILRALGYLHSKGIAHRDLKLENLLYESEGRSATLKLADFGLSWVCEPSMPMKRCCGSPEYVAPEVLAMHGYSTQCDLWSLGVVVFMLLSSQAPFPPDQLQMKRVREGAVDWHGSERWSILSADAVDFVRRLLVVDPGERMDAQQAIFHPWLLRTLGNHVVIPALDAKVLRSFQTYAASAKARRVVMQMAAQHLVPEEVARFRHAFLGLDLDNRGTIRVGDLRETLCRQNAPAELAELLGAIDVFEHDDGMGYSEFLAAATEVFNEDVCAAVFRRLDALGRTAAVVTEVDAEAVNGDSPATPTAAVAAAATLRVGDVEVFREAIFAGSLPFDEFMRFVNRGGPPSTDGLPDAARSPWGLAAAAEGVLSAARSTFLGAVAAA